MLQRGGLGSLPPKVRAYVRVVCALFRVCDRSSVRAAQCHGSWRGVAWRGSGQNLLAGACGAQGLRRRLRRAWFMLHVADYRYSDKYTANVAGWHLPREAGAKRRWAKTQMGRMAVKS
jgi:hypothetical protein